MNDNTIAKSKFQVWRQSSTEKIGSKKDRNEEKGEFPAAWGLEKKIVREEKYMRMW